MDVIADFSGIAHDIRALNAPTQLPIAGFRLIRFHSRVGVPDEPLRNTEWLCFIQQNPPISGCPTEKGRTM
jgi:hypothetical protein